MIMAFQSEWQCLKKSVDHLFFDDDHHDHDHGGYCVIDIKSTTTTTTTTTTIVQCITNQILHWMNENKNKKTFLYRLAVC